MKIQSAVNTLVDALRELLGEGTKVRLEINAKGHIKLVKYCDMDIDRHSSRRMGADELEHHVREARENKKHSIQCQADIHQIGRISLPPQADLYKAAMAEDKRIKQGIHESQNPIMDDERYIQEGKFFKDLPVIKINRGRKMTGPMPEFIQMKQNDSPKHPHVGRFLHYIDHDQIPGLVVMTVKPERECAWWKKSANRTWGVKGQVVRLVRQHGDRPPYAVIRYHDEDFDGCFDLWELRVC